MERSEVAYNFEVADYHTYAVGDNQAWVHNECDLTKKPNLNKNDSVSDFGIYEIEVNGQLHKVGKADLNRVTKVSGLPTRLHQQLRKLRNIFGKRNVQGQVVEELGETTTKAAKNAENARLRRVVDETGVVPKGNEKSFKP